MGTPGFTEKALLMAFSHLLDKKARAKGYVNMVDSQRALGLRTFLDKNYYM